MKIGKRFADFQKIFTDERSVSRSQNKAEEVLPIPLNVDEIEKFGMELSRKLDKL